MLPVIAKLRASRADRLIASILLVSVGSDIRWQHFANDVSAYFQWLMSEYQSPIFSNLGGLFRESSKAIGTHELILEANRFTGSHDNQKLSSSLLGLLHERLRTNGSTHWMRISMMSISSPWDVTDRRLMVLVDTLFYRFRTQLPFDQFDFIADEIAERTNAH